MLLENERLDMNSLLLYDLITMKEDFLQVCKSKALVMKWLLGTKESHHRFYSKQFLDKESISITN